MRRTLLLAAALALLAGPPPARAQEGPLEPAAPADAPLVSVADASHLRFVRCPSGRDCGLPEWIFPWQDLTSRDIVVQALGPEPVTITSGHLALFLGDPTVHRLIPIKVDAPEGRLKPGQQALVVVELPPDLPPGHYNGTLTLHVSKDDGSTAIDASFHTVQVHLDVRAGAFVAFLAILLGIVMAQALARLKPARARQRAYFMLDELEQEVRHDLAPEDHERMLHEIDHLYRLARRGEAASFDALHASLLARIHVLAQLKALEDRANASGDKAALQRVRDARAAALLARTDAAWEEVAKLLDKPEPKEPAPPKGWWARRRDALAARLKTWRAPRGDKAATEDSAPHAKPVPTGTAHAPTGTQPALTQPCQSGRLSCGERMKRLMGRLETPRVRAQLLWASRLPVWIVVVLLLGTLGLVEIYLPNPTFGSSPIADYFGLALWGFVGKTATQGLREKFLE